MYKKPFRQIGKVMEIPMTQCSITITIAWFSTLIHVFHVFHVGPTCSVNLYSQKCNWERNSDFLLKNSSEILARARSAFLLFLFRDVADAPVLQWTNMRAYCMYYSWLAVICLLLSCKKNELVNRSEIWTSADFWNRQFFYNFLSTDWLSLEAEVL